MSKKTLDKFFASLAGSHTEEDVKNAYARYFDIDYDTANKHDLYTKQVFFEFKFNKNFHNLKVRATTLAQTLYYIHRLKFGGDAEQPVPYQLCMADQNEAIITETWLWKEFYSDESGKYDWDLAPSSPDLNLIDDLASTPGLRNIRVYDVQNRSAFEVFAATLKIQLNPQQILWGDKKLVTEENFEDVFKYWNDVFGEAVRNGTKPSLYFVADIQEGHSRYFATESKVLFNVGDQVWKEKKILARDYEHFWSIYDRVQDPEIVRGVFAKIDRLSDESLRRFYGEFFTPVKFARKALGYIQKTVGKDWWKSGEYRLWDMAAGTGNLEYGLPSEAWKYCYMSTVDAGDVEHCKRLFREAEVFQYDYLNDDVENLFQSLDFGFSWKLPQKLRDDLANPHIKWIILINPPFATSQTAGTTGKSKADVSNTKVREIMHSENLGEVSRELFQQFLFRIKKEFSRRIAHFGLFSTLKYINSNNDQKFRDSVFNFGFESGFVFSSANFAGTKANNAFPIGFVVWKLNEEKSLESQNIVLDVFNERVEKIGIKVVPTDHREGFLSKWIDRTSANIKFPPMGSAIEVKPGNKDKRNRIAEGFLASLMCKGNDIQNQNFTAFLSGPYVSAGALSVTPDNFEQAMVVHAVRRIPKADWLSDRDQFLQPNTELSEEFVNDCAVWNLFSNSNQTASLRDVEYEGQIYQIPNHFFPFLISDIKKWKIGDSQIAEALATGIDTYVANWLAGQDLSPEAMSVIRKGKQIYQYYFENVGQIPTTKFKIENWDAGWWQIRNALGDVNLGKEIMAELKVYHGQLREKIVPEISRYGII
ncbi:MAG: hypothetical protein ABIP78_11320 [Pyrinomonadaceae bacterium]